MWTVAEKGEEVIAANLNVLVLLYKPVLVNWKGVRSGRAILVRVAMLPCARHRRALRDRLHSPPRRPWPLAPRLRHTRASAW